MSNKCVAVSKIMTDQPKFWEDLINRWDTYMGKSTINVEKAESSAKRKRGLDGPDGGESHIDSEYDGSYSTASTSTPRAGQSGSDTGKNTSSVPYHFLSAADKAERREAVQSAWDEAFVLCGIKFRAADSPELRKAISLTRACPDFRLACSKTMRTTRLNKLDDEANKFKALRMQAGMQYGFVITSDGWRSCAKKQYHNYILLSVEGPIFLGLEEVTGESGTGEAIQVCAISIVSLLSCSPALLAYCLLDTRNCCVLHRMHSKTNSRGWEMPSPRRF